jgi:hypothetical protein
VEYVSFDREARRTIVAYRARINAADFHATEHLTFDAAGSMVMGAAYHGAPVSPG